MEKPQSLLAPSFIIGSCLLACPSKNGAVAQRSEQGTHNPLVVGSIPTGPTLFQITMAWVYMLRGSKGRYYIGATENFVLRLERHNTGHVHSTKRLGLPLELVASRSFETMQEAIADVTKNSKVGSVQQGSLFSQEHGFSSGLCVVLSLIHI